MTAILILLTLICMFVLSYIRYSDLLYPPVLQSGVWLAILLAYLASGSMFEPLSSSMYFVVLAGVILFAVGSFLATMRFEPQQLPIHFDGTKCGIWGNLLFLVPVLGLPYFLWQAYQLAHGGLAASFFRNLRTSVDTQNNAFGIAQYLVTISILSAGIHFLLFRRTRPIRAFLTIAIAVVYCLLTTGRTSILLLFALLVGILAITRQMSNRKALLLFVVGAIGAFAVIALVRDFGGTDTTVARGTNAVWDSFQVYLLASLPAFDNFMHSPPELGLGSHVFRTVLAVGAKFGLCNPPPSLVQGFAALQVSTNVYTVYQPYFADFSYAGIVLAQLILGFGHGLLYRRADRGNPLYIAMFGLSLYPLSMQFFQDQYFNLLSTWIQYAVGLSLFFFLVRSRPHLEMQ